VLSRHAGTNLPPGVAISVWDPMQGPPPEESLASADAVVHLAGEPVAQRWTDAVKRGIRDSRVTGTRNLVARLATLRNKPKVLVCASAIGIYGSRGDEVLKESSGAGKGFLAETCVAWEQEAVAAETLGVRVVRVRASGGGSGMASSGCRGSTSRTWRRCSRWRWRGRCGAC
jgi:NAD dependent epimerase/dehydratase family enzyme